MCGAKYECGTPASRLLHLSLFNLLFFCRLLLRLQRLLRLFHGFISRLFRLQLQRPFSLVHGYNLCPVLATANYLERIPAEVLDRFMILYLPQYDSGDFEKVAVKILKDHSFDEQPARELARMMWSMGFRSARDVLRVARYAKGDMGQANTILAIMGSRAPPEVRRR